MDNNYVSKQIHLAVQPIPIIAKQVLENKKDDSHTNLGWDPVKSCFYSRDLPGGITIEFNVLSQSLEVLKNNEATSVSTIGKPPALVFEEITTTLSDIDEAYENLTFKTHYDLPYGTEMFEEIDEGSLSDFIDRWTHGTGAIQQFFDEEQIGLEARTWPHHFEIGDFFIVEKDEDGSMTQTIGISWAVADNIVAEPYAYVSPWDIDGLFFKLEGLAQGEWIESGNWKGIILPLSKFENFGTKSLLDFFKTAVAACDQALAN